LNLDASVAQLRREPEFVKAALARRGVELSTMDEIIGLDAEHRQLLQEAERLRAEVKELSRQVGEARRNNEEDKAEELTSTSRELGDQERMASQRVDAVAQDLREKLLMIPNIPAPDVPDGRDENDNVETRRWWVGMDQGAAFPTYAAHQRVPHWDIGIELGILDLESGAKLAGSMFPLYRGAGARLLRSLGFFALNAHMADYRDHDVDWSSSQVGRRHVRDRARRPLGHSDRRSAPHVDEPRRDPRRITVAPTPDGPDRLLSS
jgi:seryl-tRNA synthetase